MSKNSSPPLNVGTSSILFIFVILALISFSILSFVSSMSDYKLSNSVADNTASYYEACNYIEEQLSMADDTLKALYDTGISRKGYYDEVGQKRSFAYPISDIQSLCVDISILYPEALGEPFYKIDCWQVVTTGTLEYDDTLDVFK
ncbi:MAG: hypothetical protein MJ107_01540 [Lachnospiraceae bacterium]|nr:hypothetical protein [Lachnospiraceae bacterium]